jgi:hypothetical protein
LKNACPDCQGDQVRGVLPGPAADFDRIDAKNATVVFCAGPFNANLRQPGQQGEAMPQTATYSHLARRPRVDAVRILIWIEEPRFQGFGCSECAWAFNPSGPLVGNSLQEMKEYYQRRRDKEFAIHICAEHPKAKKAKA